MSEASAAADQLTREGIQAAEMTAKLTALGAKNLAALVMALLKDNEKLYGKTNLRRLLQDGKELKVVPLPKEQIDAFTREAKRYGVLFSIVNDKESSEVDLLVRAEDAAKINRIFERIQYNGIEEAAEPEAEKNADARARLESGSRVRGQNLLPEPPHTPMIEGRSGAQDLLSAPPRQLMVDEGQSVRRKKLLSAPPRALMIDEGQSIRRKKLLPEPPRTLMIDEGQSVRRQKLLPEPPRVLLLEERPSVRETIRLMQSRRKQERETPPVIQLPEAVSAAKKPDRTTRRALPKPKNKPKER